MKDRKVSTEGTILVLCAVLFVATLVALQIAAGLLSKPLGEYKADAAGKGGGGGSTTCIDSDGGLNYNVLGTVTYKSKTYKDSCITTMDVKEYYCSSKGAVYVIQFCQYGCVAGVCAQAAAQKCSDGTGNGNCSTTKPGYCQNGTLVNNCTICGCNYGQTCGTDGICSNTVNCTDTDGGRNYYVKGTTTGLDWFNHISTGTDECNGDTLTELYCSGQLYSYEYYPCSAPMSCQDGACTNACKNLCSIGDKRCYSSSSYVVCGNYNRDTCLEWSSPITCGTTQCYGNGTCGIPPP
jgi:hypothetical protein